MADIYFKKLVQNPYNKRKMGYLHQVYNKVVILFLIPPNFFQSKSFKKNEKNTFLILQM